MSVVMAPQNSMVGAVAVCMIVGGFLNGVEPRYRSLSPVMKHVFGKNDLCRAVLCCAVLCCAVLCCAVLCCAVLWFHSSTRATSRQRNDEQEDCPYGLSHPALWYAVMLHMLCRMHSMVPHICLVPGMTTMSHGVVPCIYPAS